MLAKSSGSANVAPVCTLFIATPIRRRCRSRRVVRAGSGARRAARCRAPWAHSNMDTSSLAPSVKPRPRLGSLQRARTPSTGCPIRRVPAPETVKHPVKSMVNQAGTGEIPHQMAASSSGCLDKIDWTTPPHLRDPLRDRAFRNTVHTMPETCQPKAAPPRGAAHDRPRPHPGGPFRLQFIVRARPCDGDGPARPGSAGLPVTMPATTSTRRSGPSSRPCPTGPEPSSGRLRPCGAVRTRPRDHPPGHRGPEPCAGPAPISCSTR